MAKNQYEWLLFVAKLWRNSQDDDQDETVPAMERVDGVLGKLAPSARKPANENTFMRTLRVSGGEFLISYVQNSNAKFNFLCKVLAFFDHKSPEKCKTRSTGFFLGKLDFMRVCGLFATLAQSSIPCTPPHKKRKPSG